MTHQYKPAQYLLLGLTGPTGSGKSVAAKAFANRGYTVIDADRLARKATSRRSPVLRDLADCFGRQILTSSGALNREELAKIAFSSPENERLLNEITHPMILALFREAVIAGADEGKSYFLFDAPLLIESGADRLCGMNIAVLAPREQRLGRIMERDGLTREEAELRMSAQPDDDFYRSRCRFVLNNDGDLASFKKEAGALANFFKVKWDAQKKK